MSLLRNILLWWRILDATVSRDILYFILFNYAQLPLNLSRCSFRQSIQFFISLFLSLSSHCCFSFVCPPSQFRFQFSISRLAFWNELKCSIEFSLLLCAKLSMQVARSLSLPLSVSLSLSVSLCGLFSRFHVVPGALTFGLQSLSICVFGTDKCRSSLWCQFTWNVPRRFSYDNLGSAMICVLCTICRKSVRLSNFESYTVIQNVYLGYCMSFLWKALAFKQLCKGLIMNN